MDVMRGHGMAWHGKKQQTFLIEKCIGDIFNKDN